MSFYLKPPRGHINFHKLEECVNQRLIFYENISKEEFQITNLDCLIEDSPLDRTGHFILRLQAFTKISFKSEFIKCEVKLLETRLNSYNNIKDVSFFLKTLVRHCKDTLSTNEVNDKIKHILILLVHVCKQQLHKEYSKHVFNNHLSANRDCHEYIIKVPFYYCGSLVAKREVNLVQGYAEIECSQWKTLLLCLFEEYLKLILKETRMDVYQSILLDDRVRQVLERVKSYNMSVKDQDISSFDLKNINNESKLFPLCMQSLYRILLNANRLPHNARFDLSLYLKGIGVSMMDSLNFWEAAYSKQHSSCSKCTHNWQTNEKRYIYGIRHLYGLEGSRKNYSVRSCSYLQNQTLGAMEEGGCPFKHFDDENLRRILKEILPKHEDAIEVMIYERKEDPNESCKLFYENIVRIISKQDSPESRSFFDPVQYYLKLKEDIVKFL